MQMYSDYEGLSLLSCIVWVGNIFIYTWNPNDLCTQLLWLFVCFFSVPTGPSLSAVSTPGGATQKKRSHGPPIIAVIRTVAMAVGQL